LKIIANELGSKIECKLSDISIIYMKDGVYWFEFFKKFKQIETDLKNNLEDFMYVPGKRLVSASGDADSLTITLNNGKHSYEMEETGYFLNKKDIKFIECEKYRNGYNIYTFYVEKYEGIAKKLIPLKFSIPIQNITQPLVKYFAEK
jgi:hypothetical protein